MRRAVPATALRTWLSACRVAASLETQPAFPAAVAASLASRGVSLEAVAEAVRRELGCRRPVDHGDDDLAFLVQRLASEAALQAQLSGIAPSGTPCLAGLLDAAGCGASLRDVAAALARPRARLPRGTTHEHPAEA